MTSAYLAMIDQLKKLRDDFGVEGLKAEYEAEASRFEEVLRLKDLCARTGLSLTLKVGGARALRDLAEAKALAVDTIVGPMIESSEALEIFISGVDEVFGDPGPLYGSRPAVLFNVETIQTIDNIDDLYGSAAFSDSDGIVLGRGDLVESMGLPRSAVDCDECFLAASKAILAAKDLGKTTVMGGSFTARSIPFVHMLGAEKLDRYETRKVCFATLEAVAKDPEEGIAEALDFELMWMEYKRDYYRSMSMEDDGRIAALVKRKAS